MIANWEGPYRVNECLKNKAYYLESMNGKKFPKTWNYFHLQQLIKDNKNYNGGGSRINNSFI